MKHEDVWGSQDERWKGKEPAGWWLKRWRRFRRPLLRVGAMVLLLQLLGAGYLETGFSLRTSTLIDEAAEQCRDRENSLSRQGCAPAIWRICHLEYPNSVSGSVGSVTVRGAVSRLCGIAQFAEVAELAFVLASKYDERYYFEYWGDIYDPPKSPPQEFYCFHNITYKRIFWFWPQKFEEDSDYFFPPNVGSCLVPSIDTRDTTVYTSSFSGSARRTLLKLWRPVVSQQLIDYSSAWPTDRRRTDENLLLPEMPSTKRTDTELISDWGPEETELSCYAARNALREKRPEAQIATDRCLSAAEQTCQNTTDSTKRHCTAAYLTQIERLWQQLPSVCAHAEDISEEHPDDSCRKAARRICQTPNTAHSPITEYSSLKFILEITCNLARPVGYKHDSSSEDTVLDSNSPG